MNFGLQVCPVCNREHDMAPFIQPQNGNFFHCDNCGKFTLSFPVSVRLKTFSDEDIRRKKLSEYIQNHQQNYGPYITVEILDACGDI